MRIVEPQVAMALLHRKSEQIPPIMPTNTSPIQMQPTVSIADSKRIIEKKIFN